MIVNAIVEIPKNSIYKYEIKSRILYLDRVLNQSIPYNYGYIPDTLCEDRDPLDVFILSNRKIYPSTRVEIQIIGGFKCLDGGVSDDKLFGLLVGEKQPYDFTNDIRSYLTTYKTDFIIQKDLTKEEAIEVYLQSKI